MKIVITLLLCIISLVAKPLQQVQNSASASQRDALLSYTSSDITLHKTNTYTVSKGWNLLSTPKDGINIPKTLKNNSKIKLILSFDEASKLWASSKELNTTNEQILFLNYLEAYTNFFVLAKEETTLTIVSNTINATCKAFSNSNKYNILINSGKSKKESISKDNSISLSSRYISHHTFGIYDDTRIALIYPKIEASTQRTYKYAPAIPKTSIRFAKEYENRKFYMYNYKEEKCYMGIFPSKKIPPFPVLKAL